MYHSRMGNTMLMATLCIFLSIGLAALLYIFIISYEPSHTINQQVIATGQVERTTNDFYNGTNATIKVDQGPTIKINEGNSIQDIKKLNGFQLGKDFASNSNVVIPKHTKVKFVVKHKISNILHRNFEDDRIEPIIKK